MPPRTWRKQKTRITDGRRILELRERLGLPQHELAARAGVSASYLSRIETGSVTPGMASRHVRSLALELGVGLDDITIPAIPAGTAATTAVAS